MGTSCPSLLADLFLDSYEAGIFSEKKPRIPQRQDGGTK
jgi:hypothetical protein